ncbi:hypothetical protein NAC44_06055 [Allorhizobium sp. BGMRC 0089]|uniref:hypothetical protein n=1 Tax=Allorhizobium sonneratiae TaxID=2934936 RepID=UPI0020340CBC|nr:hypothetical protein [Allorhizobium sonneratiae]MCM2291890.1 hypothetical protein [Allorhizobium sonneratiae]
MVDTVTHLSQIEDFITNACGVPDLQWVKEKYDAFLLGSNPEDAFRLASILSLSHPFYVPEMGEESAKNLELTQVQLGEAVMRARLTASRSAQTNILVAALPKSASTFISTSLRKALDLPNVVLMAPSLLAQPPFSMGIWLREQETDELALMVHGLNRTGYVAQHHIRCTPYLCRQMALYNIRPIVTYRNVFDSLVSYDDMRRADRESWLSNLKGDDIYLVDGLPDNYNDLDDETRLNLMVAREAAWYLEFYMSWKVCERQGLVKPLWVSYEKDFLASKQVLAERMAEFLKPREIDAKKLAAQFEDKESARDARFNKGVKGRGKGLPDSAKEIVRKVFEPYCAQFDFSEILPDVF